MNTSALPTPVVLIEDDQRYRESVTALLDLAPGFRLARSFSSAVEALGSPIWDSDPPRLVLMDLDLPGMSGSEATRVLKQRSPTTLVVVLTVFEEPEAILGAICSGADGYLLKRTAPGELLEQMQNVLAGGAPLTAGVARTVLGLVRRSGGTPPRAEAAAALALSDREREVLRALVDGLAYKQIAARLGVSIDTVRTHIRALYKKLHVHSVGEAVSRGLRDHLTE